MFFFPETFVANMTWKQVTADIVLTFFVLGQTLFGTEFPETNFTKKLFIFVQFRLFFGLDSFRLFRILSTVAKMHDSLRHSGRLVDEKLLAAKTADCFILMQSETNTLLIWAEKRRAILTSCASLKSFSVKIPCCRWRILMVLYREVFHDCLVQTSWWILHHIVHTHKRWEIHEISNVSPSIQR